MGRHGPALEGSFRAGAKEVDTPTDAGGLRTKEGREHELLSKADDRQTRHLTHESTIGHGTDESEKLAGPLNFVPP